MGLYLVNCDREKVFVESPTLTALEIRDLFKVPRAWRLYQEALDPDMAGWTKLLADTDVVPLPAWLSTVPLTNGG